MRSGLAEVPEKLSVRISRQDKARLYLAASKVPGSRPLALARDLLLAALAAHEAQATTTSKDGGA